MARNYRKERASETQNLVAAQFRAAGWHHAESTGAGRPGRDVLGVLGVAVEVKARRDFNPVAFVRQAASTADGDLPVAIVRPDGMGPATVDQWPCVLLLGDLLGLLREAGYLEDERRAELRDGGAA